MRPTNPLVLTSILLAAIHLAGCGVRPEQPSLTPESVSVDVDLGKVSALFGFADYRYIEYPETESLAGSAVTAAGLRGEVLGFEPGPQLYADGGPSSGSTIVMRVVVKEITDGSEPLLRTVSVVLPSTTDQDPEDFGSAMPAGTRLVLYLTEAVDLPPGTEQGLMIPVSPQGFVVAASDERADGIVYPLAHEIVRDESLLDQLPAG